MSDLLMRDVVHEDWVWWPRSNGLQYYVVVWGLKRAKQPTHLHGHMMVASNFVFAHPQIMRLSDLQIFRSTFSRSLAPTSPDPTRPTLRSSDLQIYVFQDPCTHLPRSYESDPQIFRSSDLQIYVFQVSWLKHRFRLEIYAATSLHPPPPILRHSDLQIFRSTTSRSHG